MSTYYCKCGKTFTKNTTASTTGNRMPDYGPNHECYGCLYVYETWVRNYSPDTQNQKVHECRASQILRYESSVRMDLDDKCVGKIYSLDFDFLHRVRDYADTLEGNEPDRYAFSSRPSDYSDDGRYTLTIYPTHNNKGIQAKKLLFEQFFNSDGSRKDIPPELEKQLILENINKAKEAAQSMNDNIGMAAEEFCGTKYTDGHGKVYHVGPCEDGKFRVFFGFDWDRNHDVIPCGNIPKCDTAGIAQHMLDDYAARRGYEAIPEPDEQPEPDYDDSQIDDSDYMDIAIDVDDDVSEMEQDDPDYESYPEHENADDGVPLDDEDPEMEQEPDVGECPDNVENDDHDFKNNSTENENDSDESENAGDDIDRVVIGDRISLLDGVFDEFVDIWDRKINDALKVALTSHERKFDFNVKITFERIGERFTVTEESGYKFEPINRKSKSVLSSEISIALDTEGNPVIPYDRERQMTFDDMQQKAEPLKTTVDGNTCLVENVESAGQLEFGEGVPDSSSQDTVYLCDNIDCPFFGLSDNHDAVCCFEDEPISSLYKDDLNQAVTKHNCCNDTVLAKYKAVSEGE